MIGRTLMYEFPGISHILDEMPLNQGAVIEYLPDEFHVAEIILND